MDNQLISIIVPVFNVDQYLEYCIESILAQTITNYEMILIDDGSTDHSPSICDRYAEKHPQIFVFHQTHLGVADTRNIGLKYSKGDYVVFVDSDDYINPKMLEILYNHLLEFKADISICSFEKVFSHSKQELPDYDRKLCCYTNIEACEQLFSEEYLDMAVCWNKLYKKDLFQNIAFPMGIIHEDEAVAYKLLYQASLIVYTNAKLYYYFQNEKGIMGKGFSKKSLDLLTVYENRIIFMEQNKQMDLLQKSMMEYCNRTISYYQIMNKIYEVEFFKVRI